MSPRQNGTAWNGFDHALKEIYRINRQVKKVIEDLKKDLEGAEWGAGEAIRKVDEAERNLKDANAVVLLFWADYVDYFNTLKDKEQAFQQQVTFAQDELEHWKRGSFRQTAISYCIAFESFLRDFLIEWIESEPHRLKDHIQKKIDTVVNSYPRGLGLVGSISNLPKEKDDIDECVAVDYPAFQDLTGSVTIAYRSILGMEPFGKFVEKQNVLTEASYKAALADIRLLFQIRHTVVHRRGIPDKKYRRAIRKHGCYDRISSKTKKETQEDPSPDHILSSDAVDTAADKLDEFENSLISYAQYIIAICNNTNACS